MSLLGANVLPLRLTWGSTDCSSISGFSTCLEERDAAQHVREGKK